MNTSMQKSSKAFLAASWIALLVGISAYLVGLWHSTMQLNEKGFYFTVFMYGLFAAVSLQKSVRDRLEGIPVTATYFRLCALSMLLATFLLVAGLLNATLTASEKGFYAVSFVLALFAAITLQKNIRDLERIEHDSSTVDSAEDYLSHLK